MRNKKIIALLVLVVITASGCSKKTAEINTTGVESDKAITETTVVSKESEKIITLISDAKEVEPTVKATETSVETKPEVKVEEKVVAVEQKKTESTTVSTAPKTEPAKVTTPTNVVTPTKPITSTKLTSIPKPGKNSFEDGSPKGVVLGNAKISEASGFTKEQMDLLNDALVKNKAAYDDFQKKKTFVGMTYVDIDENGNRVFTPTVTAGNALVIAKDILRDTNIRNAEVTAMCNEVMYVQSEVGNYAWTWIAKLGYKNWMDFQNSNSVEAIDFLSCRGGFETFYSDFRSIKNGEEVY